MSKMPSSIFLPCNALPVLLLANMHYFLVTCPNVFIVHMGGCVDHISA